MGPFPQFDRQKGRGSVSALCCGLLVANLALALPAFAADSGGGGADGGEDGFFHPPRRALREGSVGSHGLQPRPSLGHKVASVSRGMAASLLDRDFDDIPWLTAARKETARARLKRLESGHLRPFERVHGWRVV
jgi:hypothetical protein